MSDAAGSVLNRKTEPKLRKLNHLNVFKTKKGFSNNLKKIESKTFSPISSIVFCLEGVKNVFLNRVAFRYKKNIYIFWENRNRGFSFKKPENRTDSLESRLFGFRFFSNRRITNVYVRHHFDSY